MPIQTDKMKTPARPGSEVGLRPARGSVSAFMAESLVAQVRALRSESGGRLVLRDIERVHRMRVACRRLRTRIGIFHASIPEGKAGSWDGKIRRLGKALGEARDLDVQIMSVRKYLKNSERRDYRPGLNRLILRFKQRRTLLQKKVLKAVRKMNESAVLDEIETGMRRARARHSLAVANSDTSALPALAGSAVIANLEELLGWEIYVPHPECLKELHSMRIAAKHMRYTLEAVAGIFEGKLDEYIFVTRQIQDLLGEMHDCDVWASKIPRFLEAEREMMAEYTGSDWGMARLRPGISAFRRDREGRRRRKYREFAAFWANLRENGTWEGLVKIVGPGVVAENPEGPGLKQEAKA